VVEKGLTVQGKSLKEHLEATNHAEALDYVKKLVNQKRHDLTLDTIFNIHSLILKKIEESNAGRYRTQHVRLTGSTTVLPNPLKVPDLMDEFIAWLVGENNNHIVGIAADAHYKLVSIHPFTDGNGRTSRLLMNLLLIQEGYPPAIIRKEDRLAYINSLEKAQTGGGMEDFYNLIHDAVDRSLDIYLEALEPERESKKEIEISQRFYTTDEVALLLKIDPETVRRYVRSGALKAVKLGGKFIRIEKADLDSFIGTLKK